MNTNPRIELTVEQDDAQRTYRIRVKVTNPNSGVKIPKEILMKMLSSENYTLNISDVVDFILNDPKVLADIYNKVQSLERNGYRHFNFEQGVVH